jgi:uncharacterized protein
VKPQHFAALAGTLLLVAIVLMAIGRPQGNQAPGAAAQAPTRTVTVTGDGETRVRPDLAQVTIGIVMHRASAAEAEAQSVASAKEVQTAMVEAGAEADRVELGPVTVKTTTYQDFAGTPRISGFEAHITVLAGVRNTAKTQSVVDAALGAGATSVESVVYTLENPEPARQSAMKAALENARQRGAAMAKDLGALRSMEVLLQDGTGTAGSPGALVFRARVRTVFEY